MGTRLPPGEAERRRKARSAFTFSDAAYKHYNTRTEGFGSVEDWIRIAEALSGGASPVKVKTTKVPKDLEWFGLDALPTDTVGLKKAFRNACFVYHPDHGGTEADFQAMYAAYQRLLKQY
jgi:hypothetical protein